MISSGGYFFYKENINQAELKYSAEEKTLKGV